MFSCDHINYKNSHLTNLIHQNELFDVNKILDETLLPPNSSRSFAEPMEHILETSNSK